ncbi:alpha/beta hydrolase family protein [Corynebacterium sanguinis]|uniref:Alpha/beta hydrolase n=1 Tax=Corynebacterium sanguinis TaxID=2594913 RepID=A0A6C1TZ51_9CORY|nr:hypothetical protein [Corynebacterium sanguinis]TVS29240.1 hypothetical protein EKI59_04080 [Corynebacterium sanguinis]
MSPRHSQVRINHRAYTTFPHWFGPESAPLFACLDVPERPATTAVIVVAPLGEEKLTTHRGLRYFGAELARDSCAVLRLDLPGTGNSFGPSREMPTWPQWEHSLTVAARHLLELGADELIVVGVKMASFLIESWYASVDTDLAQAVTGIVHWEPPLSGKRWLREQQVKFAITAGPIDEDMTTSALDFRLLEEMVPTLQGLEWKSAPLKPGAQRRVALQARSRHSAQSPLLAASTQLPLTESSPFFSPPSLIHHVPASDVDALVATIRALRSPADSRSGSGVAPEALADLRTAAHFELGGERIVETISLATPRNLLTFTTRSAERASEALVIFESTALEPSWGPAYLWVAYARHNAGDGISFVRHDTDNCGESGEVEPDDIAILYSSQSRADAIAVAEEVAHALPYRPQTDAPGERDVTLVGMCSGAWKAAEAAIELQARSVVLINLTQWSRRQRPVDKRLVRAHGLDPRTGKLIAQDQRALRSVRRDQWKRHLGGVGRRLPLFIWSLGATLGLIQFSGPMLRDLTRRGVDVKVLFSPVDFEHFNRHRGPELLRAKRSVARRTHLRRLEVPFGDHSLHRADSRRETAEVLDSTLAKIRESYCTTEAGA